MNEKLDWIFSRRSVRQFSTNKIPGEMIEDILQAGMAAPSARARDPWRFIVIEEQKTMQAMLERLPNGKMLESATAAFLVCGDLQAAHDGLESYMLQDVSACIENMLLAINTLGLGGCWIGVHPREERIQALREYFLLQDNIVPIAAIALGWPEVILRKRTRYTADYIIERR